MEETQVRKVVQVGSWLVEVSLGFPGGSSGAAAAAAEGHMPSVGVRIVRPCSPEEQEPISTPHDAQEERARAARPKRKREADDAQQQADGDAGEEATKRRKSHDGDQAASDDEDDPPSQVMGWADVPNEVLLHILRELPVVDLVSSVPLVCRSWRQPSRDLQLWLGLHRQHLGCDPLVVDRDRKCRVPWRRSPCSDASLRVQADDNEDEALLVSCMTNLLVPLRLERAYQLDLADVEKHALERQRDAWFSRGLALPARKCCEAIALRGDQPRQRIEEVSPLERFRTAIQLGRDDLAWLVIEHETKAIEWHLKTHKGCKVLSKIVCRGNTHFMRMLVERGVITKGLCDRSFTRGMTDLIDNDEVEQLQRLLEAGVPACPIYLACVMCLPETESRRKMAELLIKHGADVTDQLMVENVFNLAQAEEKVRMLLELGASPTLLHQKLSATDRRNFASLPARERCLGLLERWAARAATTSSTPSVVDECHQRHPGQE
jgi:hypothetical protein